MTIKFQEMADHGTAAEVIVDGLGSVEVVGNTLRFSFYSYHRAAEENRLVLEVRWDTASWLAAEDLFRQVRAVIARMEPPGLTFPAEAPGTH